MKYLLLTILILLTGCSQQELGSELEIKTIDEKVTSEITTIDSEQEIERSKTGKYKHIKKEEKDGFSIKQNECVKPDSSVGYWVEIETDEYYEIRNIVGNCTLDRIINYDISTSTSI